MPENKLSPQEEKSFQDWYSSWASKTGMNPNPDDPQHFYDYRAAYKAGVVPPEKGGHWPSTYKREGHPNLIVDGVNTKTGEKVMPEEKQKLDFAFFEQLEKMLNALKDFHLTEKKQPTPETLDKIGAGGGLAKEAAKDLEAHNKEIEKVAKDL